MMRGAYYYIFVLAWFSMSWRDESLKIAKKLFLMITFIL